jgi:NADH-quinone oxidoreductase subunit C
MKPCAEDIHLNTGHFLNNTELNKMKELEILDSLKEEFSADIVSVDESSDILTVTVNKGCIREVILFLKDELGFGFLTDLCGVHYPDKELSLGVVYHLHNMIENKRIRIKTFASPEKPKIPSVSKIFSAANWMERETYDFFGIRFKGHPNLIRILNVEYLDYFPLRKEFPLEDQTRTDKDDRFFGR